MKNKRDSFFVFLIILIIFVGIAVGLFCLYTGKSINDLDFVSFNFNNSNIKEEKSNKLKIVMIFSEVGTDDTILPLAFSMPDGISLAFSIYANNLIDLIDEAKQKNFNTLLDLDNNLYQNNINFYLNKISEMPNPDILYLGVNIKTLEELLKQVNYRIILINNSVNNINNNIKIKYFDIFIDNNHSREYILSKFSELEEIAKNNDRAICVALSDITTFNTLKEWIRNKPEIEFVSI